MKDVHTYENTKMLYNSDTFWVHKFHSHTFPTHWHNNIEIAHASAGGFVYQVEGVRIELFPGDILFIWPGEMHSILSSANPQGTFLLQFDAEPVTNCIDFKKNSYLFYNTRLLKASENPELSKVLSQRLESIFSLWSAETHFIEMRVWSLIYLFFAELYDGLCLITPGNDSTEKRSCTAAKRIADACEYIINNCTTDLTLDDMAEYSGFSKCYFSQLFKDQTGETFSMFLLKERMRIAEALLTDPDVSVITAAEQSGFGSISAFNRNFLKLKGINPTDFRKLYNRKAILPKNDR